MAAKEKTNLLEVIPCRSEHITAEREGETIVLSFPRFKYSWMQRFLVPKGMSKERRIYLEEHGTAVWELIDGKRTVREIIEKLADHFHHEAGYESRITIYLSQMQKQLVESNLYELEENYMDNVFLLFSFFSIHFKQSSGIRVKVHFDSRVLIE